MKSDQIPVYDFTEALSPFNQLKYWCSYLSQGRRISRLRLDELFTQAQIVWPYRCQVYYQLEWICPSVLWALAWSSPVILQCFVVVLGYFLPRIVLTFCIWWQRRKMHQLMLYFMNILLISLGISENLGQVLQGMTQMFACHRPALSCELAQLTQAFSQQADREKVWQDFAQRFQSEDFNFIVHMLYLNQLYGTDSVHSLQDQVIQFHERRIDRVKKATKRADLYFKLLNVICFLPIVFIVVLGPVFSQVGKELALLDKVRAVQLDTSDL